MPIGFRAILDFERPPKELVESFHGIPSSNIGDCVKKMYCMFGGIRPFNQHPLLGTAFTVKVPSGDNLAAQAALDYAQPGGYYCNRWSRLHRPSISRRYDAGLC